MGAIFLPVLGITLTFAVLAVNENILVFHYLYAVLCCCQSLFVLFFYVAFDPKVKYILNIHCCLYFANKTGFSFGLSRLYQSEQYPIVTQFNSSGSRGVQERIHPMEDWR